MSAAAQSAQLFGSKRGGPADRLRDLCSTLDACGRWLREALVTTPPLLSQADGSRSRETT
ncbi:MAG: hypothetical protein ACI835_003529 [Planctomycetota bacterium]|jgi:hypothetical protein